jgi:hypothetical protein
MEGPSQRGREKLLAFLLFFVVIGAMPPEALFWDGIGFLQWARSEPLQLDYGHALYTPLLRLWHAALNTVWYATWEFSAKLLSSLAAALFFVLLWSRLERRGLAPLASFTLAALAATTPLFWRQAGIVEPTTLTLAALLLAARSAERYGEARTLGRCTLLVAGVALALSFHVVSVFAFPWLFALARGPAGRPPARHLAVPLTALAGLPVLLSVAGKLGELAAFGRYWVAFLPEGGASSVAAHAREAGRMLVGGFPGVVVAGALGLVVVACRERRAPRACALALPYLVAFLLLGKPAVGLLVPVSLALALLAAEGLASLDRGRALRAAGVLLPLLLTYQVGHGMAWGLRRARTPDDFQEQAELLAAALPRDAVVIAGTLSHHLVWSTDAPVVPLPNELHAAGPGANAPALLRALATRAAGESGRVFLSSDAIEYLELRWGTRREELPLDPSEVVVVRRDPLLYLVPLRLGADDGRADEPLPTN